MNPSPPLLPGPGEDEDVPLLRHSHRGFGDGGAGISHQVEARYPAGDREAIGLRHLGRGQDLGEGHFLHMN